MHFYRHHIADFNTATRHLTRTERSVYRDLIELYYDTEKQITLDRGVLCRLVLARSDEEKTAVEQVLNEFFIQTPTGYFHSRCETEIDWYRTQASQKSTAGKASAEAKALRKQRALNGESTAVQQPLNSVATQSQHSVNGGSTASQLTSNQITSNDLKDITEIVKPISQPRLQVPYEQIIAEYHKQLPELDGVRDLTDKRKKQIKAIWLKDSAHQALGFWTWYFGGIRKLPFYMGENERSWRANLDFLIRPEKFVSITEKLISINHESLEDDR